MGFKDYIKKKKREFVRTQREKKKFHEALEKEELQLRREAYSEEAKRQATLQGKALAIERANKPTVVQRLVRYSQARTQQPSPVRRVVRRRVVKRVAVPKRRFKRRVKRRSVVVPKRKKRRITTRRAVKRTARVDPIAATQNWNF